jgi:hypothetical protein
MPYIRVGELTQPIGQYSVAHITASGTQIPVGIAINTTTSTSIAAGSATVTPVSMSNIIRGKRLNIVNGSNWENVTVTAITGTTFTAVFTGTYSGTTNIYSVDGAWLGPLIVGSPGTTNTITLYNGLPGMLPVAGTAIAVITPSSSIGSYGFATECDKGLFYTTAASCDLSLHYLDHPPVVTR